MQFERDLLRVYRSIQKYAPRWLRIMGYTSLEVFKTELSYSRATVVEVVSGWIILDEYVPSVRVTVHPCFLEKPTKTAVEEFRTIREELFANGIARIQVSVFETAGHTLRKILRELGFEQESILKNYARDLCSIENPLISVEIWSILKQPLEKE